MYFQSSDLRLIKTEVVLKYIRSEEITEDGIMFNKNRSCIEIHISLEIPQNQQSFNKNRSCIEILLHEGIYDVVPGLIKTEVVLKYFLFDQLNNSFKV